MLIFRSLASGSSGNAYLLKTDRATLLFEAGLRLSTLTYCLASEDVAPSSLDAVFVSHEHADHCASAHELSTGFGVAIYATGDVLRAAGLEDVPGAGRIEASQPVTIGDVRVECFEVDHDSVRPVGFLIRTQQRVIALATDLGAANESVNRAISQADLVVLESNHDAGMLRSGRYPYQLRERVAGPNGHLSNTQAGHVLARHLRDDACEVWLAHLSRENNTPKLATATVQALLKAAGRKQLVAVARRDRPSLRWTGRLRPQQLSLFSD